MCAVSNFAQEHPKTRNRVCKGTQNVTSNNVASVCMKLKIEFTGFRGRYVFNWGARGGAGALEGRVASETKCFQIGEGQTRFVRNHGSITLFSAREKLLQVAFFKVNSFYLLVSIQKSFEN